MLAVIAATVAIVGGVSYIIGLWDWPKFAVRDFLPNETTPRKELYAIVATSRNRSYGRAIPRLLEITKQGILDADSNSLEFLRESAQLYGAPKGAEQLSVGLYFDDPSQTEKPKWAIGWCVATATFDKAQELSANVSSKVKLEEDEFIRAVRVGGPDPVLAARIPWRHALTPMVAPMLHWKRGFAAYEKGGFTTKGDPPKGSTCAHYGGAVACEVYVTGPENSMEFIDYVVLMGNTENVWRDSFPSVSAE